MDRSVEAAIAALAAAQHALFARRQLRGRVDPRVIKRRVASGILVEESSNVLRVAAAPRTDEQRAMAATLDIRGSIASGPAAVWLWAIPGFALRDVEISVPRTCEHRSSLAVVRQPRLWLPEHATVRRGIPVMSLAWTIYDIAGRVPRRRLLWIVDRVGNQSPTILQQLHDLLPVLAESGRDGIADVRWVLAQNPAGTRPPGSGNERRFLEVMDSAGIKGLRKQVDLGGHEWVGRVDFMCELTGVIFEIDSETHHTSPADVAADEVRDAAMRAAGTPDVVRIWSELLWKQPSEVVQIVTRARRRALRAA